MPSDPRIRAAAASAAKQIKAETNIHNARLEAIYRGFQQQVAAIQAEAITTDPITEEHYE